MKRIKAVSSIILLSVLTACGGGSGSGDNTGNSNPSSNVIDNLGEGDVAGNESFLFANNSALLSGPTFGSNKNANVELRKSVPFEVIGESTDIVAERVVIIREEENFSEPFVVAYIRNNSDSIRCGILFDDIEIVHNDGETFQVVNHLFTPGSVNYDDDNNDGSKSAAHNCLPANGTGYHVIAGSGQGLYDEVARVRFSLGDTFNISGEIQALDGTVLPVSYDVVETAPDGLITLSVSVHNNLPHTIQIAPPNVFALDEKGQVLMYSAVGLENTAEAFRFDAGETKAVTIIMYLSGQASTIRASVFFYFPR